MAVYVDSIKRRYSILKTCHMVADTDKELHVMAKRVGCASNMHQPSGCPHYDLTLPRRRTAISNGAKVISDKDMQDRMLKHRQLKIK